MLHLIEVFVFLSWSTNVSILVLSCGWTKPADAGKGGSSAYVFPPGLPPTAQRAATSRCCAPVPGHPGFAQNLNHVALRPELLCLLTRDFTPGSRPPTSLTAIPAVPAPAPVPSSKHYRRYRSPAVHNWPQSIPASWGPRLSSHQLHGSARLQSFRQCRFKTRVPAGWGRLHCGRWPGNPTSRPHPTPPISSGNPCSARHQQQYCQKPGRGWLHQQSSPGQCRCTMCCGITAARARHSIRVLQWKMCHEQLFRHWSGCKNHPGVPDEEGRASRKV